MNLNISKATASEYAFVIGKIPGGTGIHDVDALKLNIFSVELPSISLMNTEFRWQGKYIDVHTGGITFDPLNINFLVDVNFENWKVLYNWMMLIANNKDTPSINPNECVTDAGIIIYDNFKNKHTEIVFKNLWIYSLGAATFSIRDGETHIESSATFRYDRYEVI